MPMHEKGYLGRQLLKSRFVLFTSSYRRVLSVLIIILLLLFAGILRFEQARSADVASDAEATKTEQENDSSSTSDNKLINYEPETCIKIMRLNGSEATVMLFSTTKLTEASNYDLYVIEKNEGEWVRDAYIRTIQMPAADKTRNGKYRYYSDAVKVEWLSEGTIYQLIPHDEDNNHSSVPFWTALS